MGNFSIYADGWMDAVIIATDDKVWIADEDWGGLSDV